MKTPRRWGEAGVLRGGEGEQEGGYAMSSIRREIVEMFQRRRREGHRMAGDHMYCFLDVCSCC